LVGGVGKFGDVGEGPREQAHTVAGSKPRVGSEPVLERRLGAGLFPELETERSGEDSRLKVNDHARTGRTDVDEQLLDLRGWIRNLLRAFEAA
jgi:hypothetical protein